MCQALPFDSALLLPTTTTHAFTNYAPEDLVVHIFALLYRQLSDDAS